MADVRADRVNELYRGEIFDSALQRACQDRIHWMCSQVAGDDVLDIGCSQGITSLLLGREGHQVTGVDVDPSAIEHAKRELEQENDYVKSKVRFIQVGGEALPFEDESFDTVILGEVVEHLTRPDRLMREALRLLRTQGRIIITTPFGIHPHPGHVRTFYLGNFVEMVSAWFAVHSLHVADGYIYCVAIKNPAVADGGVEWSAGQLLPICESAFQSKEQRHWEQRDRLADQAKLLRENLAKVKSELDAAKKSAAEIKTRHNDLERQFKVQRDGEAVVLGRIRKAIHSFNGTQDQNVGTDAGTGSAGEPSKGGTTKAELERVEGLVQQSLRAYESHVKHLAGQHESRIRALQRAEQELRDNLAALQGELEQAKQSLVKSEAQAARLQTDLQKANELRAKAERLNEQLRSRLNSLAEDLRHSEQLHLEQVRYQLGDALIRAMGSPKDLVLLPGRLVKLFMTGVRRRRERAALEAVQNSGQMHQPAATAAPRPTPGASPKPAASSPTQGAAKVAAPASKPSVPAAAAAAIPGAEVFERAPFAPHLGTGIDPKVTVFAKPPPNGSRLRVGTILDEFSRDCFAPEFDPVAFRPDNWAHVLKVTGAHLLLVESAWNGNDGSWQYRIASYAKKMGEELADLVECCKRNGVPTVFWNKEDPAHFDRFIDKAALFDIVLTTDEDCIPEYRQRLGHDRVYALPFAAQPRIHHPMQSEPRLAKACFAGAFYGDRFEQRREDMIGLLRAAMSVGLDIYDRMFDAPPKEREKYKFPDEFQPAIRGRLQYNKMVEAYRRYRVFLNVNSVRHSPTMCSRRVFELLACGTPVVSTYAKGIEELVGPNGVFLVESEAEARKALEKLLHDNDAWARASAMGLRKVLSEHTYAHRFAQICEWAGLGNAAPQQPRVAAVMPVRSEADFAAAAKVMADQSYADLEMHLFVAQVDGSDNTTRSQADRLMEQVRNAARGRPLRCWSDGDLETQIRGFLESASVDIICSIRPDAVYDGNYVHDAALVFGIPGVEFIGKACRFEANGNSSLSLVGEGNENRLVDEVPTATFSARKSAVAPELLRRILVDNCLLRPEGHQILSTHRYGFAQSPAEAATTHKEVWSLSI